MSTVSLFPLNSKFTVLKEQKFFRPSFLSTGKFKPEDELRDAGAYTGSTLIVEPGTAMRIEAFGSNVSDKDWPRVKVSIFIEGKRMVRCYVNLKELDSLNWEPLIEVPHAERKETQKVIVTLNDTTLPSRCWPDCMDSHYPRIGGGTKVLNVLKLIENEVKFKAFVANAQATVGEAMVKKGRNAHHYQIRISSTFYFKITLAEGYMHGSLEKIVDSLQIGAGTYASKWETLAMVEPNDPLDFTKVITDHLKKKHDF